MRLHLRAAELNDRNSRGPAVVFIERIQLMLQHSETLGRRASEFGRRYLLCKAPASAVFVYAYTNQITLHSKLRLFLVHRDAFFGYWTGDGK